MTKDRVLTSSAIKDQIVRAYKATQGRVAELQKEWDQEMEELDRLEKLMQALNIDGVASEVEDA